MDEAKSVITITEARYLMMVYGDLYINKTNKNSDIGIIRAFQVKRKEGFILDLVRKKYAGEYGDYLVQIENEFCVMDKKVIFTDFFKDSGRALFYEQKRRSEQGT